MLSPIFNWTGKQLSEWKAVHSADLSFDNEEYGTFVDKNELDWHLIRIFRNEFLFSRLRVTIKISPIELDGPFIYLHHYGCGDIGKITLSGEVVALCQNAEIEVTHEGRLLIINAIYDSEHPSVSVGSATNSDIYEGSGKKLFHIHEIEIQVLSQKDLVRNGLPLEDRIRLIDVGGAGGLQDKWLREADEITPIIFEPNQDEADRLIGYISRFPGGKVITEALANINSERYLNIAEYWGCTSMLEPNFDVLSKYSIGHIFNIKKRELVKCVRYDYLYQQGLVPVPDIIKIDVQGFEYEVLLGFGSLLQECLAIELEAHLYPIYKNQKLLHDIVDLLDNFGLSLIKIRPVDNFDGNLVEVDAFFSRRTNYNDKKDPTKNRKIEKILKVWA